MAIVIATMQTRTWTAHTVTTDDGDVLGYVTDTPRECTCQRCQGRRFEASLPTDGTLRFTRGVGEFPTLAMAVNATVTAQTVRRT